MGELKQKCKGCNKDIPYEVEFACPECGKCILCGNDMDSYNKEKGRYDCECYKYDHDWD